MIYIELCFLFMRRIIVITNDKELFRWLRGIYPYVNYVSDYSDDSSIISIMNRLDKYEFCYKNRVISGLSRNGLCYVVFETIQEIAENHFLSTRVDVLHGSCVEKDGKAFAFLAGTNRGKSTLVSQLIKQGYRYMSDDYVIFNGDNTRIMPFHLPIKLRTLCYTSAVEEKQIIVRDFNPVKEENYYLIRPGVLSQNKMYPLQAVFQIERSQEARAIKKLDGKESFRTMVFYSKMADKNSIKKLMINAVSLARIIDVYNIRFSETEECVDFISETINRHYDTHE